MPEAFDSALNDYLRNESAQIAREQEITERLELQYAELEDKGYFELYGDSVYIAAYEDLKEAIYEAIQYDEGDTKFKLVNP